MTPYGNIAPDAAQAWSVDREAVRIALSHAAECQTAFWEALFDLEVTCEAVGLLELDNEDLRESWDVDRLLEHVTDVKRSGGIDFFTALRAEVQP